MFKIHSKFCYNMRENIVPAIFALTVFLIINCDKQQSLGETIKTNHLASLPFLPLKKKPQSMGFYRCSPNHRINMIARCPPGYSDGEVIRKCEKGLFPPDEEDVTIFVPTTNHKSLVHYANQYCAACHNDSSAKMWQLEIIWPQFTQTDYQNKTEKELASKVYFDEGSKEYMVNISGQPQPCLLQPVRPQNLSLTSCPQPIISECPSMYEGSKDCHQRTRSKEVLICSSFGYIFLNEECARCNNISENSIVPCLQHILRSSAAQSMSGMRRISADAVCRVASIAKYYCPNVNT